MTVLPCISTKMIYTTCCIHDMLKDWHDRNKLLQSIAFDINEVFLAGARAMGIFNKLVTAPLWNILESEGSILDVNDDLLQMKQVLIHWTNDGSEPLSGARMFPESKVDIKTDEFAISGLCKSCLPYASLFC